MKNKNDLVIVEIKIVNDNYTPSNPDKPRSMTLSNGKWLLENDVKEVLSGSTEIGSIAVVKILRKVAIEKGLKIIGEKTPKKQVENISDSIALTNDDIAEFYHKKTGGHAKTKPMSSVYDWAVKQKEIVVIDKEGRLAFAKDVKKQQMIYLVKFTDKRLHYIFNGRGKYLYKHFDTPEAKTSYMIVVNKESGKASVKILNEKKFDFSNYFSLGTFNTDENCEIVNFKSSGVIKNNTI